MNTQREKSFLVFSGGNDRAVLGFLRALRQCGKRAAIVGRTKDDRILRTRFRHDVHWVRENHDLTIEIFAQCLQHVRESVGEQILVVLPSTEYFNAFLLTHRSEIESMGCEIPLVEAPIYNLLTDKHSATDYFAACGLSVPNEVHASKSMEPPLVAKPLKNISRQGRSLYPELLTTRPELDAFFADHDQADYFLQEFVHGKSLYLFLYMPRDGSGELRWSQRNLMQQPNGKSMLLAEPAAFHRSSSAARIISGLRQTGFWGLGMIEVIQARDRDVFIEMNPRIWGPVQFCIDQRQPLLQAFIGEALHDDPTRFTSPLANLPATRKKYFWLGGLADTFAMGKSPIWHSKRRSIPALVAGALRDDVYLRADSWLTFCHDLKNSLKLALHRESTES